MDNIYNDGSDYLGHTDMGELENSIDGKYNLSTKTLKKYKRYNTAKIINSYALLIYAWRHEIALTIDDYEEISLEINLAMNDLTKIEKSLAINQAIEHKELNTVTVTDVVTFAINWASGAFAGAAYYGSKGAIPWSGTAFYYCYECYVTSWNIIEAKLQGRYDPNGVYSMIGNFEIQILQNDGSYSNILLTVASVANMQNAYTTFLNARGLWEIIGSLANLQSAILSSIQDATKLINDTEKTPESEKEEDEK